MQPADRPGQRQPELVAGDAQLGLGRQPGAVRARVGVADVDADHARHQRRVLLREVVAEDAAPVVQHQRDRRAAVGLQRHLVQQRGQLGQRMRAAFIVGREAGPREAHAAKARRQRGHRVVP
ncbi:MAG: hypothetical protein QM750_11465 [Rubrivivax sp.]